MAEEFIEEIINEETDEKKPKMRIDIDIMDTKYTIKADKRQYILYRVAEKTNKETGETEEALVDAMYYPHIEFLLEDLMEMEKRKNNCRTLEGYAKHIKKINKEIQPILEALVEHSSTKTVLKKALERMCNE